MIRFEYLEGQDQEGKKCWMPYIPIDFQHGEKKVPVKAALVDTGASQTVLPTEMAPYLGIQYDHDDFIDIGTANGQIRIYRSSSKINYTLRDPDSNMEFKWSGDVYFTLRTQAILLGHKDCLDKFNITFKGREKIVEMEPLFRTESIGRGKIKKKKKGKKK